MILTSSKNFSNTNLKLLYEMCKLWKSQALRMYWLLKRS